MKFYCNHCDTTFSYTGNDDAVCPHCGVGVTTENPVLTHPANRPMSVTKAREIISWLGWRDFKKAQPSFVEDHPELRPLSRANRKLLTKGVNKHERNRSNAQHKDSN